MGSDVSRSQKVVCQETQPLVKNILNRSSRNISSSVHLTITVFIVWACSTRWLSVSEHTKFSLTRLSLPTSLTLPTSYFDVVSHRTAWAYLIHHGQMFLAHGWTTSFHGHPQAPLSIHTRPTVTQVNRPQVHSQAPHTYIHMYTHIHTSSTHTHTHETNGHTGKHTTGTPTSSPPPTCTPNCNHTTHTLYLPDNLYQHGQRHVQLGTEQFSCACRQTCSKLTMEWRRER